MIKAYKKDCNYSYTAGFFPTFELINNKKDKLRCIYVSSNSKSSSGYLKLIQLVDNRKIIFSDNIFSKLKEKDNDHIIGIFDKYEEELEPNLPHVVLVNPSDMGNLGNIMRSMLAFNYLDLAIITPSCDRYNPKTIRSSMGACFSIRQELFSSFEDYLNKYRKEYFPFMLQAKNYMHEIKKPLDNNYALVFGNEASGLDISFLNKQAIKIEQSDKVDSLNLATAVVLALYDFKFNKN